ncbi:MAG: Trk system potassium transporter TrkA [Sphingomonadales bacterium]
MQVIICGAGQVGFHIAKYLSHQHNDVTVIDSSRTLVRKIEESLDVKALVGYASDPDLLDRADAASADMLVAVTNSDEVNMVACQVAHSLFNVPTKIARIRNQSYLNPKWQNLFSREHLPIDITISPEIEIAKALGRRLEVPGTFEMLPFANNKIRVLGTRLSDTCPVINTPLRQLTELFPDLYITILAVIRENKLFIPDPDDPLLENDNIYFSVKEDNVARAMLTFGHEEKEARHLIIVGGGQVGSNLAKIIESSNPNTRVKIIEFNKQRAEKIAATMDKTIVINGDALDTDILNEANVKATETLIAVSNDDEVNILSSLLAKNLGADRTITLINNAIYAPLMGNLGIDVYMDPKETTVSTILQYIRRGKILGLHSIRNGEAEIIEAEVLDSSPISGKSINDMDLPDGIMIGAISRKNEVIMPRAATLFHTGDKVVVLAKEEVVKKVEELFSVRI